jgi:hypothetical protein
MPADVVELIAKKLEKLEPGQLALELMRLPAKRRVELIVGRPDAQEVMAVLDANDFFYTVQEIGPDDSLSVLALATEEQLNHLFDIEWWRKDTLQPAKALAWVDRLRQAGGPKLLEWLSMADFELLVSLFKHWLTVDTAPEDIDLIEAAENLPKMTLDDLYFWESKYPQYDELMTYVLTRIFEVNYGFFKELLNSVINVSTTEVEETAYHFHRARLADHAVPDFYDAMEIYRAIGPDEFRSKAAPANGEDDAPRPSFALALLPEGDLFGRVVKRIEDPDLAGTIQMEMAALANKVIVADQLPPDNAGALRSAVEKTLAYLNLGLELRAGANIEKAHAIVRDNFMEHLFRLAQAEVSKIRGRLRTTVKSGWLGQCPTGIKSLDGEWLDAVEELLGKTPKIFTNSSAEGVSAPLPTYDYFRTPQDLDRGNYMVDVIIAAGEIHRILGLDPKEIGPKLWAKGQVRAPEDVTLGITVLTAAANFLTDGKWEPKPLCCKSWPKLFSCLQPSDMDSAIMDWVYRVLSPAKRSLIQAYLTTILRDYDFEMRPFSPYNPPDPAMVKFFMFSE